MASRSSKPSLNGSQPTLAVQTNCKLISAMRSIEVLQTPLPGSMSSKGTEVKLELDPETTLTLQSIRYAAPPTGSLRWQAPQPPASNRSTVLPADRFASQCPQSTLSLDGLVLPGLTSGSGSEDCLFLNVYAPANASNLPVLVWIHGGGYGLGNGQQDLSRIINANNNSFVGVAIQYRVGIGTTL